MMYRLYVIQKVNRRTGLCDDSGEWQKRWTLVAKFKDGCLAVNGAKHACSIYSHMVAKVYRVDSPCHQETSPSVTSFPSHNPKILRKRNPV